MGVMPWPVVGANVRAVFQPQPNDFLIALERHSAHRRLGAIIHAIHFRTPFQNHSGGLKMAVVIGQHEERSSFGIGDFTGGSANRWSAFGPPKLFGS